MIWKGLNNPSIYMHTSLNKITSFKALITSGYMIFFSNMVLGLEEWRRMEAVGWYFWMHNLNFTHEESCASQIKTKWPSPHNLEKVMLKLYWTAFGYVVLLSTSNLVSSIKLPWVHRCTLNALCVAIHYLLVLRWSTKSKKQICLK